ncbi:aldo/keto reductase [Luteipulveratus sp. YIM 133132]|uniref:aldo/keto reductase n=1 Tax=Luteipulveratus flavus TaxID=3031728 RepID=UPI0023AEB4F5|nr:aldo/keto reductase [Luteipulveratus sp. YIM 133132]MDE9365502.1 aldo/keto reductase [Luteipulveratus sp. YIM 133132]
MAEALVLGTMYFGGRTDTATSFALIDRFVEAGGRMLDTANAYAFWAGGSGLSETAIGEWLRANPGADIEVASKVGMTPAGDGVEGLGADIVRRELVGSLDRLGLDRLDVYWAHGEDRSTPDEEVVETFGALVQEELVGRIGLSNHPTWRVERMRMLAQQRGLPEFDLLQLTTSYVEPRPGAHVEGKDHPYGFANLETADYLAAHPDVGLWAYSPLIQGAYDRDDRPLPPAYDHPATSARLAVLGEVAAELGAKPGQVVLAWLLARGVRPIIGTSSIAQLDEAIEAAALTLSDDQRRRLDEPA